MKANASHILVKKSTQIVIWYCLNSNSQYITVCLIIAEQFYMFCIYSTYSMSNSFINVTSKLSVIINVVTKNFHLKYHDLQFYSPHTHFYLNCKNIYLLARETNILVAHISTFSFEIWDLLLGPVYIFDQAMKTRCSLQESLFDWQNKQNQHS